MIMGGQVGPGGEVGGRYFGVGIRWEGEGNEFFPLLPICTLHAERFLYVSKKFSLPSKDLKMKRLKVMYFVICRNSYE